MTRRRLAGFIGNNKGSVAIEFSILATTFVLLLLGILQFSLFFLARIAMHDALSDLATGEGSALVAAADRNGTRDFICERLLLAPNCRNTLRLEMRELRSASAQSMSTTFVRGNTGHLILVRAEAPILVFVPLTSELRARGMSVFLRS